MFKLHINHLLQRTLVEEDTTSSCYDSTLLSGGILEYQCAVRNLAFVWQNLVASGKSYEIGLSVLQCLSIVAISLGKGK